MAAKKASSKKRKKVSTSRRKTSTSRSSSKKTSRKKVAKKKVAKKVTKKASRSGAHKASRSGAHKVAKKTSAKKVSRKKASKKKVAKKVTKKASKKKVAKKATRSGAHKVTKKTTRKTSKKKAAPAKKAASRKRPATRKKAARKAPARRARSRGDVLSGPIHGIEPYKPLRGEDYMSGDQLEHFDEILNAWKRELMFEVDRTVHHMQDEAANFPDPNDRATQESEFGLELRTRDRERKLLRKIDSALIRIDDGSYGFCDETGEEIGLKRLEARPVATLSLEAQERRELAERQFRDRDDRYR